MQKKLDNKIIICLFFMVSIRLIYADYNVFPLDSEYHNEYTLSSTIQNLTSKYPKQVDRSVLGYTETDNKEIILLSIKKNINIINKDKPNILVIGQIHSEEPIGVEIALKFANLLLDGKQKSLLNHYNFFIIPTLNPEGFSIVNNGISNYHRKNKKDTNHNGKFDLIEDGVDLNRNFSFNWNVEEKTESNNRYYAGEKPLSENEVNALTNFLQDNQIFITFSYHSSFNGTYNEMIFFPYNHDEGKSPHFEIMTDIATRLSSKLPIDYFLKTDKRLYAVHTSKTNKMGYLRDYVYEYFQSLAFDIEVGGINQEGQSVVFPPNSKLSEIIDKNINSLSLCLTDISNNIHKGLLVKQGRPLPLTVISENSSNIKKNIRTNQYGYFFIYNPQNQDKFNIFHQDNTNQNLIFNPDNHNIQIFHIEN